MSSLDAVSWGIDCHVHAWDQRLLSYSWMHSAKLPAVTLVPDRAALDAASIHGVILVEAGADSTQRHEETEWMLSQVGADVVGVIGAAGWEDVSVPEARKNLVGVRLNVLGAANTRDSTQRIAETCSAASSSGFPVDVLCSPAEFHLIARSLELVNDVVLVIDHLGRPPVDEGWNSTAARTWHRDLEILGRHAGVRVKISGVSPRSTDFVAATLDLLGTDRCLLGSDWPMNRSGLYRDRVHDVITAAGGHVDSALGTSTAMSTYHLTTD